MSKSILSDSLALTSALLFLQGIQMQPDTVTQFQADIFAGRWDAALALLPKLTFDSDVALQARSFSKEKF